MCDCVEQLWNFEMFLESFMNVKCAGPATVIMPGKSSLGKAGLHLSWNIVCEKHLLRCLCALWWVMSFLKLTATNLGRVAAPEKVEQKSMPLRGWTILLKVLEHVIPIYRCVICACLCLCCFCYRLARLSWWKRRGTCRGNSAKTSTAKAACWTAQRRLVD